MYHRIKHSCYWENLKSDIQQYIQCLQCQLKKLVRIITKQSMIIIDMPASFDKVTMNIIENSVKNRKR